MNQKPEVGTLQHKLSHIHGIRALAIIWVVVGHNSAYMQDSILMIFSHIARHPLDFSRLVNKSLWSNFLNNAYHAVQTFFFLSGFLLISVLMNKKILKKTTFKLFWGLRYIRFAIPLLGAIVIHKCISMLGNSPFNSPEIFNTTYRGCDDKHWWKQLFFYNNLIHPSDSCIYFAWYLCADLQIHLIGFLLVIALRKQLYTNFYLICLFFGSLTIIIPAILIHFGIPTFEAVDFFIDFSADISIAAQIFLYAAPWIHMAAFFYGCTIGLAFIKQKKCFISTSKLWWNLSLMVLIITALMSVPSLKILYNSHLLRAGIIALIYGSWVIALSIIIYQMSADHYPKHTTFVRNLLSCFILRIISRLSFCMYLTQLTISHINFVLNDDLLRANQAQVVSFTILFFHISLYELITFHIIHIGSFYICNIISNNNAKLGVICFIRMSNQ